jgi:hypothetical protein
MEENLTLNLAILKDYDRMRIKTITTWNNYLYKKYAHKFESSYCWDFPLEVYNEDQDFF